MARKKMDVATTISICGQIEEATANYLLEKYPTEITKIPLEQFPSRDLSPEVWRDSSGQEAVFAIRLPRRLLEEFKEVEANLRA